MTSPEYCNKLIELGTESLSEGNLLEGMKYFSKAEAIAKKHSWPDQLLHIKNHLAKIYNDKGSYGDAMEYCLEALEIAKKCKDSKKETTSIAINIGTIYLNENKPRSALAYYTKANQFAEETGWYYGIVLASVNISATYNVLGNPAEAMKYLQKIKDLPKKHPFDYLWQIYRAESLMLLGKLNEAQAIAEKIEGKIPSELDAILLELLSKIYTKQRKYELAIQYSNRGLEKSEVKLRINLFRQLGEIYFGRGDYVTALKYKDSVIFTKDSMAVVIKNMSLESQKVQQKVWDYQRESEINKGRLMAERKLFYTIISGLLAVVSVTILYLRQRKLAAERNRQMISLQLEKEINLNLLLEKEIKERDINALLEQQLLKNEIEARNRKISSKALYLSDRNRLIDDILQSISGIPEIANNLLFAEKISTLKSYLRNDNEWDNFIVHFEEVNPGFLHKLKSTHPSLSANDMRFIAYTYMNLSVKEISGLLNITNEACKKRKERIVSKIKLPTNVSLYDYLSSI